jgi:hypothetical protein
MSKYDPIPTTATPRISVEGVSHPSPGGIRLDSPNDTLGANGAAEAKSPRGSTDSNESDLVYRDALDEDVVDEKQALRDQGDVDARWEGEGGMERGYQGYAQTARVSSRADMHRTIRATELTRLAATEAIQARARRPHGSDCPRSHNRRLGGFILYRTLVCYSKGVQAHHTGPYLQWDLLAGDKDFSVA